MFGVKKTHKYRISHFDLFSLCNFAVQLFWFAVENFKLAEIFETQSLINTITHRGCLQYPYAIAHVARI